MGTSAKVSDKQRIGTATSGAHSHTRAPCSSQITPRQPREDVTTQPHSSCIFRLPAQPRGLEKTFGFVPMCQPSPVTMEHSENPHVTRGQTALRKLKSPVWLTLTR